jgi:hypothetical protein
MQVQQPNATGAPAFWINNTVYGTYQDNPTYLTQASHAGIPAAPGGGNTLKITSTEDNKRVVAWHISPNDLQWGQWYCFSAFVYVPTGVPDVKIASFLTGVFNDLNITAVKDTWTRVYVPVLISPDQDPFLGIASADPMMTGQSIYVANFNFTKGRELYPYFDGNTTDDATHHRTFDWGGGTTGTRNGGTAYATWDNVPVVTGMSPQASQSTHKNLINIWNYSDPYSESQSRFSVVIRRKR